MAWYRGKQSPAAKAEVDIVGLLLRVAGPASEITVE